MKPLVQWFSEYSVSHQNSVNIFIHKFAVPMIIFSTLGLIYPLKVFAVAGYDIALAHLLVAAVLPYYVLLAPRLVVGITLEVLAMLFLWHQIEASGVSVFLTALGVFAIAWVVQLIGHKIEGKKPSFLEDLAFLLIGPLWTMRFLYEKLGIRWNGNARGET